MKGVFLYKLLLLCCVLGIVSCQQEDYPQLHDTASLCLKVKTSGVGVSRGVQDLNDDGEVSDMELYLDGQKMYRLGVFLVEGSRVVASTVLESTDTRFSNDNKEATISFNNLDYSKTYELYAVANYGNSGDLQGAMTDIDASTILSALPLNASSDNICNVTSVYPLSLKQQVRLNPGENTVSGELKRTYARLRINVRNQSIENDLMVTSLTFPTRFTRKSVNLFTEGGAAEVAPVATSAEAVTPFVPNLQIPKITDNGSVSEATIFDTYLLESDGGTYNYSLGLKYQSKNVDETFTVNTASPITNINGIKDGGMYVMYNTAGAFLYANGNSVGAGTNYLTNNELNHNYVWKFTRTTGNNYIIESMGATGYFMQSSNMNGDRIPLTVNATDTDYFTASTPRNTNTINFESTSSNRYGYPYYMAVNGMTVCGNTSPGAFYLYKVETKSETTNVTYEASNIPIHIVDKKTGVASPLKAIRRNDFIEIVVNVSYNQETGNIDFEVLDWDKVNGDVTFD